MPITDPFVLPSDVLLIPVTELPERVRAKLAYKEGDFAITRPHVRAPSKIVSGSAATLLRKFHTPQTIVAAVLDYSLESASEPERTLEHALPLLKSLIDSRVLLPADSPDAQRVAPTLSPGEICCDFEIIAPVHVVEDTEVFHARGRGSNAATVAFKIARLDSGADLTTAFEREIEVLSHLDGDVAPRLIDHGVFGERRFIAMEWVDGVPASERAAQLQEAMRISTDADSIVEARRRLHGLAITVADAYGRLHERGVLHSDVHPNNVLVDSAGNIKIIDFGYARFLDSGHPLSLAHRAGVGFYFEPECALALLARAPEPPASLLGEQYSVAAILYQLLTGATHLDFSLRYDEMLRQIAHSDARAWSMHEVAPWPEMEQAIMKALSRDPRQRFSSMHALTERLRAIESPQRGNAATVSAPAQTTAATRTAEANSASYAAFIDRVLRRVGAGGELFCGGIGEGQAMPTASANHGAAGIAYAVFRVACRRSDPQLLALADIWITKSLAELDNERAFYNSALEITRDTVSEISLHHMAPGLHFVRALVSQASADAVNAQRALDGYIARSQHETDNLDLTLGRASILHGCTMLMGAGKDNRAVDFASLERLGTDVMSVIWRSVGTYGPIATSKELTYLGMAHGWAGVLYSTLRWCQLKAQVSGKALASCLPAGATERLEQLATCATPSGRGLLWPWSNSEGEASSGVPFMPGWCNGNAGFVFLWTLAHELFDDRRYLDLACKAAWGVVEQPVHFNNLCCGASGCAYALLSLYRHTDDSSWLAFAHRYANRAVTIPDPPAEHATDVHSLYKGEVGTMVLLEDLGDVRDARMPLFE